MKRLRLWVAILSIWLVFFFNIERTFFEADVNIIRSDTYIFVAAVTLITLVLPRLRVFYFSAVLIIATSLFLFFWYQDPKWGKSVASSFTHLNAISLLTIIQVNAIVLTGLLARQITYGLSEFEDVIANITFGHIGKRPNPFSEEQSAMYREVKRARRYERPLTVMALKIDEEVIHYALPQMIERVQQAMMKEYTLAGIARILDENLQGFDTIALWDNNFVLMLPETSAGQVLHIAQRLERAIKDKMNISVKVGTASFPDQAMTFDSLIELAMANADRHEDVRFTIKHKQQSLTQEA